jgi:hypothetical protein
MITSDELLQKLEMSEVQAAEPAPEVAQRVWQALEVRLGSGEVPLELDAAPLLAEVPRRAVTLKLLLGGALVVLAVIGGIAAMQPRSEPIAREPVLESDAPVQREREAEIELPPKMPSTTPIEPPLVEVAPEPVDEAKPKEKPKPKPEPRTLTLADEVELIEAISKGLKQGAWKQVLSLVAEHEREFPDGQFIEERHAAKARAQCRGGKLEAGQKVAEAFAARWTSSIHLAAVRQDCAL